MLASSDRWNARRSSRRFLCRRFLRCRNCYSSNHRSSRGSCGTSSSSCSSLRSRSSSNRSRRSARRLIRGDTDSGTIRRCSPKCFS